MGIITSYDTMITFNVSPKSIYNHNNTAEVPMEEVDLEYITNQLQERDIYISKNNSTKTTTEKTLNIKTNTEETILKYNLKGKSNLGSIEIEIQTIHEKYQKEKKKALTYTIITTGKEPNEHVARDIREVIQNNHKKLKLIVNNS